VAGAWEESSVLYLATLDASSKKCLSGSILLDKEN
jgi:hypothetical protein